MQYIQDHFREPLSLDEISASASVSKSRALQIFQDHIQVSPIAYLISYRLRTRLFCSQKQKNPFPPLRKKQVFLIPVIFAGHGKSITV